MRWPSNFFTVVNFTCYFYFLFHLNASLVTAIKSYVIQKFLLHQNVGQFIRFAIEWILIHFRIIVSPFAINCLLWLEILVCPIPFYCHSRDSCYSRTVNIYTSLEWYAQRSRSSSLFLNSKKYNLCMQNSTQTENKIKTTLFRCECEFWYLLYVVCRSSNQHTI